MKERDGRELRSELLEQADETRRLIARFSEDSQGWPAKALLACLKNEQAILEALAVLLGKPLAGDLQRLQVEELEPSVSLEVVEVVTSVTNGALDGALVANDPLVEGDHARAIVEEFDNRDHIFERGLEKLNSWLGGGRGALPFQKRDHHAYLNRSANSEAMIARIENELMGREGFTRRLGKLKVDGLSGDILVYEKGASAGRGAEPREQ